MKVKGLDGRTHNLNPANNRLNSSPSEPHLRARRLLEDIYPSHTRHEEVNLPGTSLVADFMILSERILVEVQGRQHDEYVPHFHKNRHGFAKSMGRDNTKRQWCELNDFELIELPSSETDDEWRERFY